MVPPLLHVASRDAGRVYGWRFDANLRGPAPPPGAGRGCDRRGRRTPGRGRSARQPDIGGFEPQRRRHRGADPAFRGECRRRPARARGDAAQSPDRSFTAAVFKDRSGVGRNLTIAILEYLDKMGATRRVGDARRVLRGSELVG
jgi:hypothetical protein